MINKRPVAVLFARVDSIYKTIENTEVYDIERDALTFTGGMPVVAHPPCRAWGRLRTFANPRPGEKELAIWAIDQVRTNGGILEHPAFSTLWDESRLPLPGQTADSYGGYTIDVDQSNWGHRAKKRSWFYVVGIKKKQLPPMPIKFDAITHVVQSRKKDSRPHISKAEREITPFNLAYWLIEAARRTTVLKDCPTV